MEKKLTEPAFKVVVERVHWDALAPILSNWLGFYPSLKSVTPSIFHFLLTDEALSIKACNWFVKILLGRHRGSAYQSPGVGGVLDVDGRRAVWFGSYMQSREVHVCRTDYGWRAEFSFPDGSVNAASRLLGCASNGDYGYVVARNDRGEIVAQSNFVAATPAPREGWQWLPFHLLEEAQYLLDYLDHLGDRVEVTSAVFKALQQRAILDQNAALAALARAAE